MPVWSDLKFNIEKLFPANRFGLIGYIAGGSLLAVCYFLFFHPDIVVINIFSSRYLIGNPLEFYERCKNVYPGGAPYPPLPYIIFAIWLVPLKLLGLIDAPISTALPPTAYQFIAYWAKALTTLVFFATGFVFYKVTLHYNINKSWRKYATAAWLTAPLALFSQFIFSQCDILYIFFTVLGFLFYLRRRLFIFSLCFGMAISFKYFPTFVFIPLLLLAEKRISRLIVCLALAFAPMAIWVLLYSGHLSFLDSPTSTALVTRIFAAAISVGSWRIIYVFALFTLMCGACYIFSVKDELFARTAAYVYLAGSILPFLFIFWHPYWFDFAAPALVLTTMISRNHERFLLIDLFGMLAFVGTISCFFSEHLGMYFFQGTLLGLEFKNLFLMKNLFWLFQEHSGNVWLSVFWGYLLIHLLLKLKLILANGEEPETHAINYMLIRRQLFIGLLIFIIPFSITMYRDNTTAKALAFSIPSGSTYGELTKGRTFAQTFVAKKSYIDGIELYLATFIRMNNCQVKLEVLDASNNVLAQNVQQGRFIQDNSWHSFPLAGIPVKEGATYKIRLSSPDARPGNAITWWASDLDRLGLDSYPDGYAIVDGARKKNDFCFRIIFK